MFMLGCIYIVYMAWYQRSYFNNFFRFLFIFLILAFSFYFFGFFEQGKVLCSPYDYNRRPELLRLVVGNISILYSHTLSESDVKLMLEIYRENFIQAQLNNTINQQSFSISKFMRKNNTYFSPCSPYNHYNVSLELYNNWQWNTGAYHQLTGFYKNSIKPIDGFNFFEGSNLFLTKHPQQLISTELRFYDYDILNPIDNKNMQKQFEIFKYANQDSLTKHFGKSLDINNDVDY